MEEEAAKSPPPCPKTLTIRRNPHRNARAAPSSNIPLPLPLSSPSVMNNISSSPVQDILSIEVPNTATVTDRDSSSEDLNNIIPDVENLKVFLRIRPLAVQKTILKEGKREGLAWPKNPKSRDAPKKKEKKSSGICVMVKDDHSVMVCPPPGLQGTKRFRSELYEGFARVFSAESPQGEVYDKMVSPLVDNFLNGKSGMLAALGPSGSGKTHTVFGCTRDPGMVPRALHHIFSQDESKNDSRIFRLSMFEICSEKGKCERLCDLLRDSSNLYMQQLVIKGLQEVIVSGAQHAVSLIACGMLKRATALTNSNSQSSRSQCIISIRCTYKKVNGEIEDESNSAVLTIVDLAGAEREKKTGNQGLRLLESNFINNTSMVFGQCLRSLLEHQKNPKKPLQKNFHNSMLTKYLKPYLEGKRRMALVLTVNPGEEGYFDTSNLLKQALPFSQISFSSTTDDKYAKRPLQTFHREENQKRMKFSSLDAYVTDEKTIDEKQQTRSEGSAERADDDRFTDTSIQYKANELVKKSKREKEHQIMLRMTKALWNVLKQYKENLKAAEVDLNCLRVTLANEQKRRIDLENEVKDLKCQSSHRQEASTEVCTSEFDGSRDRDYPDCLGQASTEVPEKFGTSFMHYEDDEQLKDLNDSGPCDLGSIGGATASCTDKDGLVHQVCEESAENVDTIMYMRNLENDAAVEAGDLIIIDGATAICTDRVDLLSQECEESVENAGSIIDERYFKNAVEEALDQNITSGATAICTDGDGHVSQECVESAENAASLTDTKDLKNDIEEEGHLNNENAEDVLVSKVVAFIDNSPERWETVLSESIVALSESRATTTAIFPSFAAEIDILAQKDSKKDIDVTDGVRPKENESFTRGREDSIAPDIASKHVAYSNFQNIEKPKRRLLPASSILLKDISNLTLVDADDKFKGAKGEQKVAEDMKNKTKGSLSLLRLLRNDLDL